MQQSFWIYKHGNNKCNRDTDLTCIAEMAYLLHVDVPLLFFSWDFIIHIQFTFFVTKFRFDKPAAKAALASKGRIESRNQNLDVVYLGDNAIYKYSERDRTG